MTVLGKVKNDVQRFNKKVAADAKKAAAKLKRKPKAKAAKFAIAFALVLCVSVIWAQAPPVPVTTGAVPQAFDKFQIETDFSYLNQATSYNNFHWAGKLGGDIAGVWYLTPYFGLEADGRLYSQPGTTKGGTVFTAEFGPRLQYSFGGNSLTMVKPVSVFGHALFGAGHNSFTGFNFHAGQNGFVLVAGGGLDYRISKYVTFQAAKVDFMYTEFSPIIRNNFNIRFIPNQDNFTLGSGLTFTF